MKKGIYVVIGVLAAAGTAMIALSFFHPKYNYYPDKNENSLDSIMIPESSVVQIKEDSSVILEPEFSEAFKLNSKPSEKRNQSKQSDEAVQSASSAEESGPVFVPQTKPDTVVEKTDLFQL